MVIHEFAAFRALRNTSPSGVKCQILRSVMRSQNVRSRSSRAFRELPAMIAEFYGADRNARHPIRFDIGLV
jgi:hypothetical protein